MLNDISSFNINDLQSLIDKENSVKHLNNTQNKLMNRISKNSINLLKNTNSNELSNLNSVDFLESLDKCFKNSFNLDDYINENDNNPNQNYQKANNQILTNENEVIENYLNEQETDNFDKSKFEKDLISLFPPKHDYKSDWQIDPIFINKLNETKSFDNDCSALKELNYRQLNIDQNDTYYYHIEQILKNIGGVEDDQNDKKKENELIMVQERNTQENIKNNNIKDEIVENFQKEVSNKNLGSSPSKKQLLDMLLMEKPLEKNFGAENSAKLKAFVAETILREKIENKIENKIEIKNSQNFDGENKGRKKNCLIF